MNRIFLLGAMLFAVGCSTSLLWQLPPSLEEAAERNRQDEILAARKAAPEFIPSVGTPRVVSESAKEADETRKLAVRALLLDAFEDGNFSKANVHITLQPVFGAIETRCGRYNPFNMTLKLKCSEFQNDAWINLSKFARSLESGQLPVVGGCIKQHADSLPWAVDFVSALSCARSEIHSRAKLSEAKVDKDSPAYKKSYELGKRIRLFCERKWGDNYRMVEHCGEQQIEATQGIKAFLNNSSVPRKIRDGIFARCAKKWAGKNFETLNNVMTHHCITEQYGAYKRLNQ